MWHYSGPEDSTRSHPEEVSEETVAQWLRGITGACDNPLGAKRVWPFSVENKPPNMELTNMYSPVSNGEQVDASGESEGGSADSDYTEDIEGSDYDSEEIEEEVQSPPCNESRSKHSQDPAATPSKTLVSNTRNVKRDRAATTESAEKAAKHPKPDAPKTRKALPQMRINVSVLETRCWVHVSEWIQSWLGCRLLDFSLGGHLLEFVKR
ncbi:hypothetical protein ZWY2020_046572 [Hordeum vulgare]|nr:hypothetical protein ZWY2020_046572 [Hordeum vulgare]